MCDVVGVVRPGGLRQQPVASRAGVGAQIELGLEVFPVVVVELGLPGNDRDERIGGPTRIAVRIQVLVLFGWFPPVEPAQRYPKL
jgi:hypothetical protein